MHQYKDVLKTSAAIPPEPTLIPDVAGELQATLLAETTSAAIGAALEALLGPALKAGQGQFLHARNMRELSSFHKKGD